MNRPARDLRPVSRGRFPAGRFALGLSVVLFLVLFLLWPVARAIQSGFVHDGSPSGYWLVRAVSNPILRRQIVHSLLLACATTGACVLIALPLGLLQARCRFRGQGLLGVAVLVPMILPPFVGALSMRRILGRFGSLNLLLADAGLLDFSRSLPPDWLGSGFVAVVVLQALHLFPILYLNATAALANVDPAYNEAARNLGAGPVRTFFRITLPLMRPGLFAGGTIVFIWSLTDIGTPRIIGYPDLLSVTVFKQLVGGDAESLTYRDRKSVV